MTLTEVINQFTYKALIDEIDNPGTIIQGWVVAIVEDRRISYIRFEDTLPTYDETEARVLPKQEACDLMSEFFYKDRETWRKLRVLPVRGDTERIKGGMLPTVNGY